MRHQLDGTGYRKSADAMKITMGCPNDRCDGYELTRDLDFANTASYRPDSPNQTAWTGRAGWNPISTFQCKI